ncbi:MAG: PTS sugar transporter subunit IIA [Erysipelotrichaceae bacterium]|uniref:PTS sugar transporter subunit IIA n=1 Tax=Floccifex sp. TaxID=2815810 RepID=UPI0029FED82B|nr:PTS sugar transporter subunit IIA [Floccifex sp.]MDD7281979.1 PTS sugar transporter subunit IIA [Erysipelotrichaceae bacterium]MDY2957888.1 PTS sugar transporter subunit IIA [Floccifex sp.]
MISELLKKENCFIKESVEDWKEAIHVACQPMIEQGYCTPEYEQAVFESTEKFGPYYVLCENLALIHASAHAGVNETQMAVTVLKNPIKFSPDGYDVRILVTLVAKDSHSHMEGIVAVSNIFSDEEKVKTLLNANDGETIYRIFADNVDSQ